MKEIKSNWQLLIIMTIINLFVLWHFISVGQTLHGIGYFIFFYIAILTIYTFTKKIPPQVDIEIKVPRKELKITIIFALLGYIFLILNFILKANFPQIGFLIKLPVIIGMFLFSMPLGILIYLLLKKYKFIQLGIKTKPISHFLLGLIILGLTGLFALIFNRSGILWEQGIKEEGGFFGLILRGIIGAALVEEFYRFVIQTRFEKLFRTIGINILFASTIWAFMHFPVTYFKSREISNTLIYCVQIIPLGFIWGYLTQRTKSILPAVIVHGLNLWGFQNG
jgi:membrane protease YdiL (CAAX protease family)